MTPLHFSSHVVLGSSEEGRVVGDCPNMQEVFCSVSWKVLRYKPWAMVEGNGARVALGQDFGKELENGRARSPSGKERGSQIELPLLT